jgi:hypothetical protein
MTIPQLLHTYGVAVVPAVEMIVVKVVPAVVADFLVIILP